VIDVDVKLLDKEFDKQFIKKIKGFDYVSAEVVEQRLDDAFGKFNWAFRVDKMWSDEEEVIVWGSLGARDPDTGEWVWKSQCGGAQVIYRKDAPHTPENRVELHKRWKAAESDCIKKCATLWGVARHLYGEVEEDPLAAVMANIQRGEEELSKKLKCTETDLRNEYFGVDNDVLEAKALDELEGYLTHLRSLRDADKIEKADADKPAGPDAHFVEGQVMSENELHAAVLQLQKQVMIAEGKTNMAIQKELTGGQVDMNNAGDLDTYYKLLAKKARDLGLIEDADANS
jgi:hypothetical protein